MVKQGKRAQDALLKREKLKHAALKRKARSSRGRKSTHLQDQSGTDSLRRASTQRRRRIERRERRKWLQLPPRRLYKRMLTFV